jgi:TrmH family RNA methyltransferase
LKSDWEVEAIVVSDHGLVKEIGKLESWDVRQDIELLECSEREFNKLTDTVTSQGIVAVVKIKYNTLEGFWEKLPERSIIVALDDVADPGNIGTILRTCDWFGVNGVVLSENSVELYNSKVIRSTMGAIFHIPILPEVDLGLMMEDGKKQGFKIITTVLDGGKPLNKFSFPERPIIVFGNETHGVSKEIEQMADASITISKYGKAESLNVGISCGIILNAIRS